MLVIGLERGCLRQKSSSRLLPALPIAQVPLRLPASRMSCLFIGSKVDRVTAVRTRSSHCVPLDRSLVELERGRVAVYPFGEIPLP